MGIFGTWNKKKTQTDIQARASARATDLASKKDKPEAEKKSKINLSRTLVHPLVSEKAAIAEARGVYSLVVRNGATKPMVKQAVKEIYGVLPTKIRIMNYEGKATRFGRTPGRKSDWKKALVTLPKGQSIKVHEGV